MPNPRLEFSQPTIRNLAMSVNFRCARPGCGLVTHFYDPHSDSTVNIQGQAAHVAAASRFGPRSDVTMTPEQIRSFSNGVWLCANCATLIDRLPREYPDTMLKAWHADAVEKIRRTGLAGGWHPSHDTRLDAQAVRAFLAPVNSVILRDWIPGDRVSYEAAESMRALAGKGHWKGPGNPSLALQHAVRNRQLAMCEIAWSAFSAFNGHKRTFEPFTNDYDTVVRGYALARPRYGSINSQVEQWVLEDCTRHEEFRRLASELDAYLSGGPMTLRDVDW